ncbi:helix-turn-helix domain-containing protein [Streptomyces sp. NPDC006365]|uniref:helix-turn-helix domain-containing protein n=1 Tax=Streptomyces sp. NPDC006365 TaxID=3364744 RepID=UPI0036774785
MSKRRLVITAVVVECRTQGEVARAYGVSQGWVSRLVARYRAEGEAAFEPRSKRPKTSPTALDADTVDLIVHAYNHQRPHRSLPHRATPAAIYTTLPKALPAHSRDADTHTRVRHDRIDQSGVVTLRLAGRLHHIGIGRTHAGTHVIMLINDLDVRIVNATTGELLRDLTIDPSRDYQPTGRPPGPQRR